MTTIRIGMLIGILLAAAGCANHTPVSPRTDTPAGAAESRDASRAADDERRTTPTAAEIADRRSRAIGEELETLSDDTLDRAVIAYYDSRDNAPAWFDRQGRARPAIKALLDALSRADRQGLVVADYRAEALGQRIERANAAPGPLEPGPMAALDVRLSRVFVRYAHDLHAGRVDTGDLRPRWNDDLPDADYAGSLERATRRGDLDAALSELRPPHDGYTRLVKALADYRAIVDAGGWPRIDEGPLLETGVRDQRVVALRERLQISGDLTPGSEPGADVADGVESLENLDAPDDQAGRQRSPRFDAALADGVRAFQTRHGLKVDGKVGPATRAALNVSARARVRQIQINLERWRWLPADLGERYIMVNIPDYRLRAYDDGQPALEMKVVVGKSYNDRATPVFTDRMEYLVFRPYWNVPPAIAAEEIVPEARADSGYLASKRYEIVPAFGPDADVLDATPERLDAVEAGDLYIRQRAGASNALGLVKFMFPNEYAVYLHDSPAERLFTRNERDFSHGCVRVQYPARLAEYVLGDQRGWDAARIDEALHGDERQRVALDDSIPVYLIYWTAFVDDAGVQFRPDLYEHDPRVEKAMRRANRNPPPGERASAA